MAPHQAWIEHYRRLASQAAPWLQNARLNALERFANSGLPGRRNEAWKYSAISAHPATQLMPTQQAGALPAEFWPNSGLDWENTYQIVLVDGFFQPNLARLPTQSGVRVSAMAEATLQDAEDAELVKKYLKVDAGEDLAALNVAGWQDGFCLLLAQNVQLDKALHVIYLYTGEMSQTRSLLYMAPNSQCAIIEHVVSVGEKASFTTTSTEIIAQADARVTHYKLIEQNAAALHSASLRIDQQANSDFHSHVLALGKGMVRNQISACLSGQGAQCALSGLSVLTDQAHADHHTHIEHSTPDCTSREFYKGIYDGKAKGIFTGRVLVAPHAQRTSAQQTNHNLLLSREAEADARPQLEIYADDVQCSHGATVGQLDENALFYLCSRGVEETTARNLLIYGFAEEVLDQISDESVRAHFQARMIDQLPGGHEIQRLM